MGMPRMMPIQWEQSDVSRSLLTAAGTEVAGTMLGVVGRPVGTKAAGHSEDSGVTGHRTLKKNGTVLTVRVLVAPMHTASASSHPAMSTDRYRWA